MRNNKCYYSLIKRSENFKTIDDAVKETLLRSKEAIGKIVLKVNTLSGQSGLAAPPDGTMVDMSATLDFIDEILGGTAKAAGGFVMSFISKHYKAIGMSSIETLIRDIVTEETQNMFVNVELYDTIVVFKSI